MTLTLDVPAELESALAAKAARLGMPVERYAAGVLHRHAESDELLEAEYLEAEVKQ